MHPHTRHSADLSGSSHVVLFESARVAISEHRWSPFLASKLNSWAATTTTLVVLESGQALLSDAHASAAFSEQVQDEWMNAPRDRDATPSDVADWCCVFRYDADVVEATLPPKTLGEVGISLNVPVIGEGVVQLTPAAFFRYLWRRRALTLGYSCPDAHVEEDAIALLRYVLVCSGRRQARSLVRPYGGASRHRALATRARAILSVAIAEPHRLADLASALAVSPFHLAHIFRTEVGVSLHRFLLELRLASALARLRGGEPDLSRLALDLGFAHHSHFSAHFRRAIGHSPHEARRLLTAATITEPSIAARPRCLAAWPAGHPATNGQPKVTTSGAGDSIRHN
jgi:AraC-like DNA-binding protein